MTQNLVHDSWSFFCLPIDEMILKMTSALFVSTPCSRKKSATLSVPCLHLQCRKVWRWHHNTSPIQRADCVYNCREAWQYLSLSVTDRTQVHCCFTSKTWRFYMGLAQSIHTHNIHSLTRCAMQEEFPPGSILVILCKKHEQNTK